MLDDRDRHVITYQVNAEELLRYARGMHEVPAKNTASIVRALNETGDAVAREIRMTIVMATGLTSEAARNLVQVSRATRSNLAYEIVVDGIPVEGEEGSRKLPGREFKKRKSDESFNDDQLVKVMTRADDHVCPVCEAIAEASPYTVAEARELIHHGAGIGQNNCRCVWVPFVSRRRLAVESNRGIGGDRARAVLNEQVTLQQLARRVITEMGHNMQIKVR